MTCLVTAGALVASPLGGLGAPLGGGTAEAQAHPFGDPQRLEISREGATVRARWRAAPDDLTALALALRVLGGKRTYVYRDGALVPEESDKSDAVLLAESPRLREYLLRNIRVTEKDAACPGKVVSTGNLAADGAVLDFACPGAVTSASVTVTMLTDLHASYRTLASTAQGERHTYTKAAPTHTWSLDRSDRAGAGSNGTASWPTAAAIAAVALLASGGAVLGARRLRAGRRRAAR
ncbi:hypothetical protein Acsp03_16100 [Actinomadura sp. NBRC 104412]|nr:hypothetical protein Acsp03_16100 [Actinomadura sp. NBRC 104412]